jgi:hypothetical protein
MRNTTQKMDASHAVGGPITVEDRRHSTPLSKSVRSHQHNDASECRLYCHHFKERLSWRLAASWDTRCWIRIPAGVKRASPGSLLVENLEILLLGIIIFTKEFQEHQLKENELQI